MSHGERWIEDIEVIRVLGTRDERMKSFELFGQKDSMQHRNILGQLWLHRVTDHDRVANRNKKHLPQKDALKAP